MIYFFAGDVYETAIPAAIAMRQLAMNPNSYFKTFVGVFLGFFILVVADNKSDQFA